MHLVSWLAAHPALEPSCPHLSLVQSWAMPGRDRLARASTVLPSLPNCAHCFPFTAHSDPHAAGPLRRLASLGLGLEAGLALSRDPAAPLRGVRLAPCPSVVMGWLSQPLWDHMASSGSMLGGRG